MGRKSAGGAAAGGLREKQAGRDHSREQVAGGLFRTVGSGQYRPTAILRLTEGEAMAESELYQKGAAMRRRLLGDAAVERSAREIYSDPIMKKFIDVATETVFGALWTRPGLDLKTRALICVISDAATGREPELGLHLRMALRQGWTEEELSEALLHLSGYVGVPIIREAMMTASKVFAEYRAEPASDKMRA
jgi:4-carboxymuconolactone decarboxylase